MTGWVASIGVTAMAADCPTGREIGPATFGLCCWPGQSASGGVCVGTPACPAPLLASGEDCVAPPPAAGDARPLDRASFERLRLPFDPVTAELLRQKRMESIARLRGLLGQAGTQPESRAAWELRLADLHLALGVDGSRLDLEAARTLYEPLLSSSGGAHADGVRLGLARAQAELGLASAALDTLARFEELHPGSPTLADAQVLTGDLRFAQAGATAAAPSYRAAAGHPGHELRHYARSRLAWCLHLEGDDAGAVALLDELTAEATHWPPGAPRAAVLELVSADRGRFAH